MLSLFEILLPFFLAWRSDCYWFDYRLVEHTYTHTHVHTPDWSSDLLINFEWHTQHTRAIGTVTVLKHSISESQFNNTVAYRWQHIQITNNDTVEQRLSVVYNGTDTTTSPSPLDVDVLDILVSTWFDVNLLLHSRMPRNAIRLKSIPNVSELFLITEGHEQEQCS